MAKIDKLTKITPLSVDPAKWYNEVVLQAELADYAPVRGCMVIRPYGYALWEKIQEFMDKRIKENGVANAYFPLFIPYSLLKKEKEHVEGFSPELALVTIGGGKELDEPLVVRPTSETIMYQMFSNWIKSWRDLPFKVNQWCNVVRWEKRTYLFLRTTEFLWQEGHTCHTTEKEAMSEVMWALDMYKSLFTDLLALEPIVGRKSESEKFAGAKSTYTCEVLSRSGKAVQTGTSHLLGQNFSKSFDVKYQNKEGKNEYVWQTSWGQGTRAIGSLIFHHGDDLGLLLPPRVAPIQIIIIPVAKGDGTKVNAYAEKIKKELVQDGFRVKLDDSDQSAGYKFAYWDVRGVPIRLEIGERELADNKVTYVLRYEWEKDKKVVRHELLRDEFIEKAEAILDDVHNALLARSRKFNKEQTAEVDNWEEFEEAVEKGGWIVASWCENADCEAEIKDKTKATTRCLSLRERETRDRKAGDKCVHCGKEAKNNWYFARAY